MTPALRPGDFLWIKTSNTLKRGDLVLVKNADETLIKRVIGLSHERLAIRSGRVFINELGLSEPYILEAAYLQPQRDLALEIPPSACFVMGDARDDSLDSRKLGPIKNTDILGVVRFRFWPPKFFL